MSLKNATQAISRA
ncbi:Uncharacterized protein APZ42_019274 [Daphnia magna]|uniref:Uncharacterized protein n=1 Tax=Daphnia magna TaxID=35525 RepID=A0A164YGC5_9CRUS|nr:Uncharacterized protein APZ42_019274 [Daphnia magna]